MDALRAQLAESKAALAASEAVLSVTEAELADAEAGLAERAAQLAPYAAAANAANRCIDALAACAQFDGSKYCAELAAVGGLCHATRAEEALWSALSRAHRGRRKRTALMYAASRGKLELRTLADCARRAVRCARQWRRDSAFPRERDESCRHRAHARRGGRECGGGRRQGFFAPYICQPRGQSCRRARSARSRRERERGERRRLHRTNVCCNGERCRGRSHAAQGRRRCQRAQPLRSHCSP